MSIDISLPHDFCYVKDPNIIVDLAYCGSKNFVGRPINGYKQNILILTKQAKEALLSAQKELDLMDRDLKIKVLDGYRPTAAVEDFILWAESSDIKYKKIYYPHIDKKELFTKGYIMRNSSHSRGSAIDITLVQKNDKTQKYEELNMGTVFDFFGVESHTDSKSISHEAQANREFLQDLMHKHGFKNYYKEWWHYGLIAEPYPDTYFNFPID